MTWTPRQTESRAEFLARDDPNWWKPRVVMPWRVFFAGFVCVGIVLIIALLLIIASAP
jgi:hypothetical protein